MDENQKNLSFCALAVIVLFMVDFFVLMRPQLNIVRRITPQLNDVANKVKAVKFDVKQKDNFEKRYNAAQAKMLNMNRLIPQDEEISLVLNEISLISKESKVKILQLKPLKENKREVLSTDAGTYFRLPIYIDASCGFHRFGKFLNRIEYSDIFMKTAEMEMIQDANDMKNHQVRLVVDVFVLKK